MTDAVQVALIVAIAPTLASLASLISSLRNHDKVDKIEKSVNGMHVQMLISAEEKGEQKGRELQKLEHENNKGHKP